MGKRKSLHLRPDVFAYACELSIAEGEMTPRASVAIHKVFIALRRHGIENLHQLEERLEKKLYTSGSEIPATSGSKPN